MSAFADGVVLPETFSFGSVRDECKHIVASIDFGTACSGVAFARKSRPKDVRYAAPGARDPTEAKVPTVLLELPNDKWLFGHAAETQYNEFLMAAQRGEQISAHLYKGFKMVLKDKEAGFDSLEAFSTAGKPQNLMVLVVKTIQFLQECAISRVREETKDNPIDPVTDIQWVLTVPAIWNDFGKAFMRKAAFLAGLVSEEMSDDLILVLEPEGASLAIHAAAAQHGILAEDSRFMVLDGGGGTNDTTVHEVHSVKPLTLSAIAPPSGNACGGQMVNAQFREFLQELLGPELFDEHGQLLAFTTIYHDFDRIKLVYAAGAIVPHLPLVDVLNAPTQLIDLAAAWNAKYPNKAIVPSPSQRKGILTMSPELMLSFFEPSVQSALTLVTAVLNSVPNIQYIIVVGGFGSSQVLIDRVRQEFNNRNGVRVILPDGNPKPQGAIAHGAVFYGLYRNLIASRASPYTYGLEIKDRTTNISRIFHVLVRRGQILSFDFEVSQDLLPATLTQPHVVWKLFRSDDVAPTITVGQHFLGSVVIPCPAGNTMPERKLKARFCFGGTEIRVTGEDVRGNVTVGAVKMDEAVAAPRRV
jgi:hypothetical protein